MGGGGGGGGPGRFTGRLSGTGKRVSEMHSKCASVSESKSQVSES